MGKVWVPHTTNAHLWGSNQKQDCKWDGQTTRPSRRQEKGKPAASAGLGEPHTAHPQPRHHLPFVPLPVPAVGEVLGLQGL